MKKLAGFFIAAALLFSLAAVSKNAFACTGIQIKTQDGNYIFARSMEFAASFMPHDLIAVPRNYKFTGQAPAGKPGMPWQVKYAFVGFAPAGEKLVDDGLNEKGLHVGGFFFPGYAQYENVTEADYPTTISCLELASWILATCSSVAELRQQLPKIHVCPVVFSALGYVPPFHLIVSDKSGDAAIIEYVAGKLNIYDNKVNVITNSPDYIWQTTNLRNYLGLKASNNPAITINNNQFAQFGQGSGAVGLPGDFTPPSRFVRAAFLVDWALQGKDIDEGISVAFHILNQFDIPLGVVKGEQNGAIVYDTTQWTCASDLTGSRYFYHTYNDRSVKMVDLNKLDLNAADIKVIQDKDVQKPGQVKDISAELK